MPRDFIGSIEGKYRRYKALAEGAMDQLSPEELCSGAVGSDNAIIVMVWHISGNLQSRFTDFLSSDGEKSWRGRDSEFVPRQFNRAELMQKWEEGWDVLFNTLAELNDADLDKTVSIRSVPLDVHEALHRSLAHASYHVGQIVYVAKSLRGDTWQYLSIPPGESEAYRLDPGLEKSLNHAPSFEEFRKGRPRQEP